MADTRDAAEIMREVADIAETPVRDVTPLQHQLYGSFPVGLSPIQLRRLADWLDEIS